MPVRGSSAGSAEPTGLLRSVERAMRVLDHVAGAPGPLAAKDIARNLGLTLPTTYHLLTTLVRRGYVVRLAVEHAYALGHRVDDLARGLRRHTAGDALDGFIIRACKRAAPATHTAFRC
jgi:Fe2+ or Zn2+ uptake regulation protein